MNSNAIFRSIPVLLLLVIFLVSASVQAKLSADIWFVKAGADGDGRSIASPTGSLIVIENISNIGDTIFVLPSDSSLDGGIALKSRQSLIGLTEAGRKPSITNSNLTRNAGCGIVLADNGSVSNLRIEETFASGIYGFNTASISIDGVDIHAANRSESFIEEKYATLPGALPHGAMVFVQSETETKISVTSSLISKAAGFGIVSVTSNSARSSIKVSNTQVEGGSKIGFFDAGISALVQGSNANVNLEVFDSQVWGRFSRSGRNIMIVASGGARAVARVEKSFSGATGQDGIVAAVMQSPSQIDLYIHDSIIEDAGQMNIEGTLVNLEPADPARPNQGKIRIEIDGSTIRNAGAIEGFEDVAANIWLGGSQFQADLMPAVGSYELKITDSRIEGAGRSGLEFGDHSLLAKGWAEKSEYNVLLRANRILNNGDAEVMIHAPMARIDARRNCWGQPEGLPKNRVVVVSEAETSKFDTTEPEPCNEH
ncbi:hypothetical protein [Glaciecola petra]|uniref:Uncharacterized protein n=1 Tax=Glaciecola petra TaxID=3075602 RepID=A0ABU2ZRK3_9ALTE|nr:hypothetical protein [Aestuariibacter sp. P117]MDT0595257.1 hypothetical protein [Aestuariibacter sp. P117]